MDFPSLDIVYLDNACTSLRPQSVIDAIASYYQETPVCYGRSAHKLSQKLDTKVHEARKVIASFIGTNQKHIVMTRNATESLNWVSKMLDWKPGDVVLISDKEHNSNLIPWLKLKDQGVVVDIVATNQDNTFSIENYKDKLDEHKGNVRLVSMVMTSNIDGITFPVSEIVKLAHKNKALCSIDGCQTMLHHSLNVKKLGVDFFAFSGHKMCGPNVGVLYVKDTSLPSVFSGGSTVVSSTHTSFVEEKSPEKFEAGIQQYDNILGLAAACAFLNTHKKREKIVEDLNAHLTQQLADLIDEGTIEVLGPKDSKLRGSVFNFWVKGVDSHDVGQLLNAAGVAVRTGMHCCHSWYDARKKGTSVRASLAFYNTKEDVDIFVKELKKVIEMVA